MQSIDDLNRDIDAGEVAPERAIDRAFAALHTAGNEDLPDVLRVIHRIIEQSTNANVIRALAQVLTTEEFDQVTRDAINTAVLAPRSELEERITEFMPRIRLERVEPGPKDWKQFRRDLGKLRAAGRDDLVDHLLAGQCGMPEALSALEH